MENNKTYLRNLFSRPQKSLIVIDNQYANYKIVMTTKRETIERLTFKKTVSYVLYLDGGGSHATIYTIVKLIKLYT